MRQSTISSIAVILLLSTAVAALAQPARPRITSPQLNGQYSANLNLAWSRVSGANSYYIRVREAGSSGYLVDQSTGTRANYFFPARTHGVEGGRIEVFVYACANPDGSGCGQYSTTSAYIKGPPVTVSSPADNYTYSNSSRRPTLSWQPYTGFRPSATFGNVTYKLTFSGNGAAPQFFTTQQTTYTPAQSINPQFQNPVRWSVQACNSYNCSQASGSRSLNLTAGSTFTQLTGNVTLVSPSIGTVVDVGSRLSWQKKPSAAHYRVCLNTRNTGCRLVREVSATGSPSYTLSAADVDLKNGPLGGYAFRGKTVYWGVTACTQNNTSCVSSDTPHPRSVQVASAQGTGGDSGNSGNAGSAPQVSFAQHLYPIITSSSCSSCHPGQTLYPQNPNRTGVCAASCSSNTIPFSNTINASTMLSRFKCLKACSSDSQYSQARGKVYVVPGSPAQSGLHHKAQESSSAIFSQNRTIGGVSKPIKEWIQIWITQGANP